MGILWLNYVRMKGFIFLVFVLSFGLTGCVSPAKRAEVYPEVFAALSPAQQEKVLQGEIEVGMPEKAVCIAFGDPAYRKEGVFEGEAVVGWVYTEVHTEVIPRYTHGSSVDANGQVVVSEYYDPIYEHNWVPRCVVFIRKGVVVGWQEL